MLTLFILTTKSGQDCWVLPIHWLLAMFLLCGNSWVSPIPFFNRSFVLPNSGSYDQFWSILLSGFHLSLFIPFPLNSLASFSVSQSLHLMMDRTSIWKFMHFIDVKIHSILHKQSVFLRLYFLCNDVFQPSNFSIYSWCKIKHCI